MSLRRRYPTRARSRSREYGPAQPYSALRSAYARDQAYETRRIAQNTERLTNSFTYYGMPRYNYIQLRSTATYNVKFRYMATEQYVFETGTEAFAQVILAPAWSDMFMQKTITNYDSFVVHAIEWDYIPPATESVIAQNDGPVFPWANCVIRFVFDPTANVTNIDDVKADMDRYSSTNDATGAIARALCRDAVRNTQYQTNETLSQQHGIIRAPSCTLVNATSPIGTQGRQRIETNSTLLYMGLARTPQGVAYKSFSGTLAATYGSLSMLIPTFVNGLNRDGLAFPDFMASLSVTYLLDCYGQN